MITVHAKDNREVCLFCLVPMCDGHTIIQTHNVDLHTETQAEDRAVCWSGLFCLVSTVRLDIVYVSNH